MSNLLVTVMVWQELEENIKADVENARDYAKYLGVDRLGIVEIHDGLERYYLIKKEDFNEWFGD